MSDHIELLRGQARRYPVFTPQDACKALGQAELGPGHFVSDEEAALARIRAELPGAPKLPAEYFVEPIGERFSRLHLGAMGEVGISEATLAGLFMLSSLVSAGTRGDLEAGADALCALAAAGELPFGEAAAREYVEKWRAEGFPAVSHSEAFRAEYAPAYRVVSSEFVKLLPLFCGIDRRLAAGTGRVIVAIDGQCGSGKSTLGDALQRIYRCALFHMDDYFLRPEQRTPERFGEPGGNVDRERFAEEILVPLASGAEKITYSPFDCGVMRVGQERTIDAGRLVVVEGSYSLHPELAPMYTDRVLLSIDPELQIERIRERSGEKKLKRFIDEWIPLENRYFEQTRAAERSDFRFDAPRIEWRDAL